MPTDFRSLFAMFHNRNLRCVTVGGLALVLHGIDRLTADLDLAADLAPAAASELVDALLEAGYRPAAPVDARLFADPIIRSAWRQERGMQVFSLWDTTGKRPTIDIFTDCPVPFEELWRDAINVEVADGIPARVASVDHLIRLKRVAGRPQDLADIRRLEDLRLEGRAT